MNLSVVTLSCLDISVETFKCQGASWFFILFFKAVAQQPTTHVTNVLIRQIRKNWIDILEQSGEGAS